MRNLASFDAPKRRATMTQATVATANQRGARRGGGMRNLAATPVGTPRGRAGGGIGNFANTTERKTIDAARRQSTR